MPDRFGSGKLSFDLLAVDTSGDESKPSTGSYDSTILENGYDRLPSRKRRHKATKKNKVVSRRAALGDLIPATELREESPSVVRNGHLQDGTALSILVKRSVVETVCTVEETTLESSQVSFVALPELRQRNVKGSVAEDPGAEEATARESTDRLWKLESDEANKKLDKEESLDWNQVMAKDPSILQGKIFKGQ